MKGILIILGCAALGYIIVSLLMNTKADDLRPPADRDASPPAAPPAGTRSLPPPPTPQRGTDWTLLLDVPRSASARDIEAAFRRQQSRAEAAGDRPMVERLRMARDAALAEKKR